jgi:uncharacterized protein (DUF486 family)
MTAVAQGAVYAVPGLFLRERGSSRPMSTILVLAVSNVFSTLYLHEPLRWNHVVGFGLIGAAAFFVFRGW